MIVPTESRSRDQSAGCDISSMALAAITLDSDRAAPAESGSVAVLELSQFSGSGLALIALTYGLAIAICTRALEEAGAAGVRSGRPRDDPGENGAAPGTWVPGAARDSGAGITRRLHPRVVR